MAVRKPDLQAMLRRMERVLERTLAAAEKALKGADDLEAGPAAVKNYADLMSQIVRTVDKIHELKKASAVDIGLAGTQPLGRAEREALRLRVEQWIEERAGKRAAELFAGGTAQALRQFPGASFPGADALDATAPERDVAGNGQPFGPETVAAAQGRVDDGPRDEGDIDIEG